MEKTNNFPYFFLVPKAEIKSFLLLDQTEKKIIQIDWLPI